MSHETYLYWKVSTKGISEVFIFACYPYTISVLLIMLYAVKHYITRKTKKNLLKNKNLFNDLLFVTKK